MEELKDRNAYLKASNADGLAVLEATATWCSQCKAIQPFVEKMMHKYPDARFYHYDTGESFGLTKKLHQVANELIITAHADTALDISQELGANQMPTFHVFKDGDLMDSVTGAKAKELEAAISKNYDGKVQQDE